MYSFNNQKYMNLVKIHSISKKILVALLGGFLLVFLLFHATANLLILRHDDGAWYSAFCHFMGTNIFVKVFEVLLMATFVLHICFTSWLWFTNRKARPVRYHQPTRSKTHSGSKLMMWTGILIFVCLIVHFTDFYFVKLGWVKGEYMVKVEKLQQIDELQTLQLSSQFDMTPEEFVDELESRATEISEMEGDAAETARYIAQLRDGLEVLNIMQRAYDEGNVTEDGVWIRHLTYEERQLLREVVPESDPEPDFYFMAREKFSHLHIVLLYLFFFAIVWIHMRHAFPSAFQTLGLSNYKYYNIIDLLGKLYAWVVCLMFAAVVILVFLGL